ncbi:MAG: hypothetical protein NTZ11_17185 [Gammaproteobacteria bacterium]|nr:hypothetical protein [Gammaproteobacteria bacterium]
MHARDPLGLAVAYAIDILRQGAGIAEVVDRAGLPFADQIGPHLRHVVEHYEALLSGIDQGVIDYDNRSRDRQIERDAVLARARFDALAEALARRLERPWPEEIAVAFDGGIAGDKRFVSGSTPLRELLFVAAHAVHHYALLRLALAPRGLILPESIGKAAATLRYERERQAE